MKIIKFSFGELVDRPVYRTEVCIDFPADDLIALPPEVATLFFPRPGQHPNASQNLERLAGLVAYFEQKDADNVSSFPGRARTALNYPDDEEVDR